MSTLKHAICLGAAVAVGTGAALSQSPPASSPAPAPSLGKAITEADIKAWDVAVMPDGKGLPPGSGTAAAGARIYAEKCAACHGESGKGANVPGAGSLVGGAPLTTGIETLKTIANFWGHSTTLFDFIRRAMPFNQPRTLSDSDVYALSAYLLSINKIIDGGEVMNAQTLPKVKMPNADNFIIRFPDRI